MRNAEFFSISLFSTTIANLRYTGLLQSSHTTVYSKGKILKFCVSSVFKDTRKKSFFSIQCSSGVAPL